MIRFVKKKNCVIFFVIRFVKLQLREMVYDSALKISICQHYPNNIRHAFDFKRFFIIS